MQEGLKFIRCLVLICLAVALLMVVVEWTGPDVFVLTQKGVQVTSWEMLLQFDSQASAQGSAQDLPALSHPIQVSCSAVGIECSLLLSWS